MAKSRRFFGVTDRLQVNLTHFSISERLTSFYSTSRFSSLHFTEQSSRESLKNGTLFQVRAKELFDFVEGNHVHPVVQVHMAGTGDNEQFLVVALELLESIFAEVT